MTFFDLLTRKRPRVPAVPDGFRAVAEALRDGEDVQEPCATAGRQLAEVSVGLDEVLDSLGQTFAVMTGEEPSFSTVRTVSCAWADVSMPYLHGLHCADPLTGLATPAHLRTRLAEAYRMAGCEETSVAQTHALVVVEMTTPLLTDSGPDNVERALRFVDVAVAVHAVYPCGETVAQLGARRAVTLVRREPAIGDRIALLRQLLVDRGVDREVDRQTDREVAPRSHRVWIEGLPSDNDHVGRLLDDLAR